MSGAKKKPTIGYRYYMSLHMGGCRGPVDALIAIMVGGKKAWSGAMTASGTTAIDQPNLFGGDKGEGGIVGALTVMMGESTQAPNPALGVLHGTLLPAFRRVLTLLFDGEVCALSPNPQPWKFRVRRILAGWAGDAPWYPEKAVVALTGSDGTPIQAMNPIHILYQCATDPTFGRGLPSAFLDDALWRAAADTCYAEGLGLCIRWTRTQPVNDFCQTVVDHIGAALSWDFTTGLLSPILIRGGYEPSTLPLFDADSGLLAIESDESAAQASQVNQITVNWGDPIIDQVQTVTVSNSAAILAAGGTLNKTVSYVGLPTLALATRIAQRDLQAESAGLHKYKLTLDRRAYALRPGQPFRIRDAAGNVLIVRAGPVAQGTLSAGAITVTAVQDIYGLPDNSYVAGQPGTWNPPDHSAIAPSVQAAIEVSYRDLARNLSAADLAALDADACYLGTLARRPSPLALNYQVSSQTGAEAYVVRGSGDWCPGGTLSAAIDEIATTITLAGGVDLDLPTIPCAALIDAEIVRVDALDPVTGIATIARGCVDTVPAPHAAGAQVWLLDDYTGSDSRQYTPAEVVSAQLLTHTPSATLDPSLATPVSVTMDQRMDRPYPPGNVAINGQGWPALLTGDLTTTWAHRDRLLQADQLIDTSATDVGPEAGTTYNWRVFFDGTLEHSETAIPGTAFGPYTPTATDGLCRIELEAQRDGLTSWQMQVRQALYDAGAFIAAESGDPLITESGDSIILG